MTPGFQQRFRQNLNRRLIEYMGGSGDDPTSATCGYITRCDSGVPFDPNRLHPPDSICHFVRNNHDAARALHDRASILVHLDMEYVDFDDPFSAFNDPERAFALQEPVVRSIKRILRSYGIEPLHLLTGQGHHFIWQVDKTGPAAPLLKTLVPENGRLEHHGSFVPQFVIPRPAAEDYDAFAGVGLVLEYLAHRVVRSAAGNSEIPIELTAVTVGPSRYGRREIISLDISEYGDPLHTRNVRMPFTPYLKGQKWGNDPVKGFRTLPVNGFDLRQALALRHDEAAMTDLCRQTDVHIPEQGSGTRRLIDDYLKSDLRQSHLRYFSTRPDPSWTWDQTYRRAPIDSLPPCARFVLENPNDWLLKPAGMQLVLRCLVNQGWHPRHVGGLFTAIFTDPSFGGRSGWENYLPSQRADFYARIFSGMLETGLDGLVDFNCVSTQEKGFCPWHAEPCNLDGWREGLLQKKPR